jgi:nanoRNase/pAp phosphatase (c-di-AMP/oligoRNAs hydrolase)
MVTPEMATCLYTTVLTDTGGFCYGATRAATFALARDLVLAGADPIRIAQSVFYSTPTSKMLLLGAALSNLKREGRLAWLWVSHQDMVRACAAEEDCEGIVNFAACISGVEAAAFLRELPERRIRLSLRSRGTVNVAAIAERLGGGGWAAEATRPRPAAPWMAPCLTHLTQYWRNCGPLWAVSRLTPLEISGESVSLVPVETQYPNRAVG